MDQSLSTSLLRYVPDDLHSEEIYQTDKYMAWENLTAPENIEPLEDFVTGLLQNKRGRAKQVGEYPGSCNVVVRFSFPDEGSDVGLRFPEPGEQIDIAADLLEEKSFNEVRWMQFLGSHTNIPIPKVHAYGSAAKGLPHMGPFILMEWMEGENLYEYLISRPKDMKLDDIFTQVAGFLLELYQLRFDKIGSISKDTQGQWSVTNRPLTWDMHQMFCDIPNLPIGEWPTGPLQSSREYFNFVDRHQRNLLWADRNLNVPCHYDAENNQSVQADNGGSLDPHTVERIARFRFKARQGFTKLIDQFCLDDKDQGPFIPFNLDFGPRNMLFDRKTGRITGMIDLEYMNSMPVQFALDPPLWLALILPRACLQSDSFDSFRKHYPPYLARFLAALKRAEDQNTTTSSEPRSGSEPGPRTQAGPAHKGDPPLSELMRQSWESKRCWFNFAANYSDQVDGIYQAELGGILGDTKSRLELGKEDEYAKFAIEQAVTYVREVSQREYVSDATTAYQEGGTQRGMTQPPGGW